MNQNTVNGLLLIDKPKGITSFDIIRALRRQTGVRKIGHAGTLDPMATGLMLMLFGTTCKKATEFVGLDKTYEGQMTLGYISSTGDAEGALTGVSTRIPSDSEIEKAFASFVGEIRQTPSQYSAIKIGGVEAYKLARQGKKVHMPSRNIFIHRFELISYDYPHIVFRAHVSSGTYIRTLAEDVGEELKAGAYLSALRRTKVGDYTVEQSHQLADVNPYLLPGQLLTI